MNYMPPLTFSSILIVHYLRVTMSVYHVWIESVAKRCSQPRQWKFIFCSTSSFAAMMIRSIVLNYFRTKLCRFCCSRIYRSRSGASWLPSTTKRCRKYWVILIDMNLNLNEILRQITWAQRISKKEQYSLWWSQFSTLFALQLSGNKKIIFADCSTRSGDTYLHWILDSDC